MENKAVLVGVKLNGQDNFEASMEELKNLAAADEIETAGELTQKLDGINTAHYVGSGKLPELASVLAACEAGLAVFNDELSPSQIRNLEKELKCRIIDRTMLILDIFARRARTREAKLQVEVANLHYMMPRLIGSQESLEQQTGGVGTTNRGAGEKKLELSRRQIQDRIYRLERELETLVAQRQTQRLQRKKNAVPVVSLVGYTNAGKSTIMNAMLDMTGQPAEKRVLEKNMLFATLETSVRNISLSDNKEFLLTDTVGFISKLPHHLVKAFRSTLEEVGEADLLVHVVDSSDPGCQQQIDVTNATLAELGADGIPMIYAYNKADLVEIRPALNREDCVYLSAKDRTGMEELFKLIRKHIFEDYVRCEMLIPYSQGDAVSCLNERAHIFSTDYVSEGTRLTLECRRIDYERYHNFVIEQK